MAQSYSGGNGAFTPSTTADNWTLDLSAQAYYQARVVAIACGGSNTSSAGYRTRWTRPTGAGSGSVTGLTLGYGDPNYTSAHGALNSAYATPPTLAADPAGNLFAVDWNNQGGQIVLTLPLADQWLVIGGVLTGQLSCRNTKGTDASLSSYQVIWEE